MAQHIRFTHSESDRTQDEQIGCGRGTIDVSATGYAPRSATGLTQPISQTGQIRTLNSQTGQIRTLNSQTGQIRSFGAQNRPPEGRICPVCTAEIPICPVGVGNRAQTGHTGIVLPPNWAEQDRTERNRAEQNQAKRNRTEQDRAKQNQAKQNQAKRNRTEQDRAKQDRADRDDRAEQDTNAKTARARLPRPRPSERHRERAPRHLERITSRGAGAPGDGPRKPLRHKAFWTASPGAIAPRDVQAAPSDASRAP